MAPHSNGYRKPLILASFTIAMIFLFVVGWGLLGNGRFKAPDADDGRTITISPEGLRGHPMLPQRAHVARGQLVTALAFSPDGRMLATASFESDPRSTGTEKVIPHIQLWDVGTGNPIRELGGAQDAVLSLAFSPDGATLAGGAGLGDERSLKGEILLWTLATGEVRRRITDNVHCFPNVTFTPSGVLASAGVRIQMWDANTGENKRTIEVPNRISPQAVAFAPNGERMLAACNDGIVRVWERGGDSLFAELRGHRHSADFISISPNGTPITAGGGWNAGKMECDLIWWDLATKKPSRRIVAHSRIEGLAISPDGNLVATSGGMYKGELIIWSAADARLIWSMSPDDGKHWRVEKIAFSPDSRTLAAANHEDGVELLSLDSLKR